jgi:hypothetical protein
LREPKTDDITVGSIDTAHVQAAIRVVFNRGYFFIMTEATEVRFIFVCPHKNEVFESSDFKIMDNRGVTTDDAGNKTLDAKVALNKPCPFCGQKHVYHASELSCPFTA